MAKRTKTITATILHGIEPKKRGRRSKGNGGAHPASDRKVSKSDNQHDVSHEKMRENFLQHRRTWVQLTAKQTLLDKQWTDAKAALKADGHKVVQMRIADALSGSPKQEAKVYGEVEDRLRVARYIGHQMGAQLDLFAQPDRTPAVDRAKDQGRQASMENEPKKPPFDPSTPQYQAWMTGYDEHQRTILAGIKPLEKREGVMEADDGWGDEE